MYMYTERIDPSEFMMIKKSSDHAVTMEENRVLKTGITIFFTTLFILVITTVIYDYRKNKNTREVKDNQ